MRPTAITVIGWLFIGCGALAILSGAFAVVISIVAPPPAEPPAKTADAPLPFQIVGRIFDYMGLLGAVQIVIAALMIWSGAAFLRLRAWARTVIEAITWLGLLYTLSFGAMWIYLVSTIWREAEAAPDAMNVFFPMFIGMGAAVILSFAIPLVVILRVVRGRAVREALYRR